jgi:hypothetical protein
MISPNASCAWKVVWCAGEKSGLAPSSFANTEASQALLLIAVQPGIHRIGITRAKQSALGDLYNGEAIRDKKQGGRTLAHVGESVVIPTVHQLLTLVWGQIERSSVGHGFLPFQRRLVLPPEYTEFNCQFPSAPAECHSSMI